MSKKTFLKRTLAVALAAMLTVGAGPLAGLCGLELPSLRSFTASAAEEEPVWTVATADMLEINGNTIIGYKSELSGNIEIPTHINGTAITTIKNSAFKGCSALTAVKIPDSIEKIGWDAFQNCANLETVYFNANSCEMSDGSDAPFAYNNNLTAIVFGENVTAIPANVCANATALQTAEFKGEVTAIGSGAFENCSSLKAVDLSKVKTIGNSAFKSCVSVSSFTFSEDLETIGNIAFDGCKITEITIPAKVKNIGWDAFQNCANLETVYFNANSCEMSSGSDAPFAYNNNLTTIVFGENVTAIPANVCADVSALQTAEFKGEVTAIGSGAFENCSSLKAVDLSKVKTIGNSAFKSCVSVSSFTFSEDLETIGNIAFDGCKITEITIPAKVKNIGWDAFQNCANLETVYFNANSCEMSSGSDAPFAYNNNLTTIVFGENVTAIPANVCADVSALQSAEFKGVVTAIGSGAFENCSSLKAVDLSKVKTIGNSAFKSCVSVSSFTFSEDLETIGNSAFDGCKITEITIPAKVKNIGWDAFQNCANLETVYFNANSCEMSSGSDAPFAYNNNLTTIVFGENVTAIPANVCADVSALQTAEFKGEVTTIGSGAFENCSSLKAVDLSKVKTIGNSAFKNCVSVSSFTFSEDLETIGNSAFDGCKITEITIPAKVKNIGWDAFQNCANLETVYFNANSCGMSGGSDAPFAYNNNLTTIVFGENVTAIPANVCANASALQTAEFKGEVTKISDNAFYNCTSLENIHLAAYSEDDFDISIITIGKGNDIVTEDIFTFGIYREEKTNKEFGVTVSYINTAFNEEIKLSVTETKGTHENGSVNILDNEIREQVGCFNIKMISVETGMIVQPAKDKNVRITMPIPEQYLGKKSFRIVHVLEDDSRENFATNASNSKNKIEISADGKYLVFEVSNFSKFEVMTFDAAPTVSIKNNTGSKTISYGETLRLTANTSNMPADAKIFWYVDGVKKGEGTTFEVSPESGSVEVTVKVVDSNGNDYADADISDTEKVTVKSGFFQKLISFFKNLFGISRIVTQAFIAK